MQRRHFLTICIGCMASLVMLPTRVFAQIWNKPAFQTTAMAEAMQFLGVYELLPSAAIQVTAPDRAENGAIVQIEVISTLTNTESISILVEKNPTPLIATFRFSDATVPFVITRIKMAETSDVTVVVKAGHQYFSQVKSVIVLENGCG